MSIEVYLAYLLACILITIIPGPTVTLIIANSLTHGMRAGLLNVAGTQLGLAIMLGVLLVGLSSVIATMGVWFDWVRIAGAIYLVWLGWKLLRANTRLRTDRADAGAARRIFPAGISRADEQPEGAALVRRVHSAVRRSDRELRWANHSARADRDGDRRAY